MFVKKTYFLYEEVRSPLADVQLNDEQQEDRHELVFVGIRLQTCVIINSLVGEHFIGDLTLANLTPTRESM